VTLSGDRPVIVPVGGFLGAGKTTLILAAAAELRRQGMRAAAILNDQGMDLVDTRVVERNDIPAGQVTGGCFCCRFSDLVDAAERVREYQPDMIFAEPVGSCTDLSATTLQPLRQSYAARFRLAPFTVLADPARARDLLSPGADPDLAFLFRSQIAEADLVCFTRSDLDSDHPEVPGLPVRRVSGKTGQGVAEWLHEILAGELPVRNTILDIDYARYAEAEAALAWLNCRASVRPRTGISPTMLAGPLLDAIRAAATAEGLRIVHLKLIDEAPTGYIKAALCANDEEPRVEGTLLAEPSRDHDLLVNCRAVGDPADLRRILEAAFERLHARVSIRSLECFRPAAPRPQHRIATRL
jgi:hypothetical protein